MNTTNTNTFGYNLNYSPIFNFPTAAITEATEISQPIQTTETTEIPQPIQTTEIESSTQSPSLTSQSSTSLPPIHHCVYFSVEDLVKFRNIPSNKSESEKVQQIYNIIRQYFPNPLGLKISRKVFYQYGVHNSYIVAKDTHTQNNILYPSIHKKIIRATHPSIPIEKLKEYINIGDGGFKTVKAQPETIADPDEFNYYLNPKWIKIMAPYVKASFKKDETNQSKNSINDDDLERIYRITEKFIGSELVWFGKMCYTPRCQAILNSNKELIGMSMIPNLSFIMDRFDINLFHLINCANLDPVYQNLINKNKHIIALQIIDCVKEMHDKNTIHKDIKPENIGIILQDDHSFERAVLIDPDFAHDFDLAKDCNNRGGSDCYVAPELVKSKQPYQAEEGKKMDIFSLGITLVTLFSQTTKYFFYNKLHLKYDYNRVFLTKGIAIPGLPGHYGFFNPKNLEPDVENEEKIIFDMLHHIPLNRPSIDEVKRRFKALYTASS